MAKVEEEEQPKTPFEYQWIAPSDKGSNKTPSEYAAV